MELLRFTMIAFSVYPRDSFRRLACMRTCRSQWSRWSSSNRWKTARNSSSTSTSSWRRTWRIWSRTIAESRWKPDAIGWHRSWRRSRGIRPRGIRYRQYTHRWKNIVGNRRWRTWCTWSWQFWLMARLLIHGRSRKIEGL